MKFAYVPQNLTILEKNHGINLDKTATVFPVCNTNQSHANTTMLLVIDRFQHPFGGAGMRLFECSVRSK